MVNMALLEEMIKNNRLTDRDIAKALNIDLSTWYRRKLAPNKINIGEIEVLKKILNISNEQAQVIFLS